MSKNRLALVLALVPTVFASPASAAPQGVPNFDLLSIFDLLPDLTPHLMTSYPVSGELGTDCARIDFEGLTNSQAIGVVPGPVEVTFGPSWIGLVDLDDGGTGNFANEPSSNTIAFFMDAADPIEFDPPVRFLQVWYTSTAASTPVTLIAWDGPGGTGNRLDRKTGRVIGTDFDGAPCGGDPTGSFCLFDNLALSAPGDLIKSITIQGAQGNSFGFDDMEFCTTVPFDPYCYGTGCPCGNDDSGAGCANSRGVGAELTAKGTPSIGADDMRFLVLDVPTQVYGLLFMSRQPGCVAFGDGLRAMGPGSPIFRFPTDFSGIAGRFSFGPGLIAESQSFNNGVITVGSTWSFQSYYRDSQGPCGTRFNLSNGIRVTFSL